MFCSLWLWSTPVWRVDRSVHLSSTHHQTRMYSLWAPDLWLSPVDRLRELQLLLCWDPRFGTARMSCREWTVQVGVIGHNYSQSCYFDSLYWITEKKAMKPLSSRCKPNIVGRQCDLCAPGYYGYPNCRSCDCHQAGTKPSVCDPVTGQCHCKVSLMWLTLSCLPINVFSVE